MTVVFVVLAIACFIALWPRQTLNASPPDHANSGTVPEVTRTPVPLDVLRQQAALQPCPKPERGAPAATGPLAGINVPCLGSAGTLDVAAAFAGRLVLLNEWASWCGPCRDEIPTLAAYAAEPGAIPVLGIDVVSDSPGDALSLLSELNAHYPSVVDSEDKVLPALGGPPFIPRSLLLLPDGSVKPLPPMVFTSTQQVRDVVDRYRP